MVSLHKSILIAALSVGILSAASVHAMSFGSFMPTMPSMPSVPTMPSMSNMPAMPSVGSSDGSGASSDNSSTSSSDGSSTDSSSSNASDTSDVDLTSSQVYDTDYQVTGSLTIETGASLYVYGNLNVVGNVTINGGKLKVKGNLQVVGDLTNNDGSVYVFGKRQITGTVTSNKKQLDREFATIDPYLLADISADDLTQVDGLLTDSKNAQTYAEKKVAYESLAQYIQPQDEKFFAKLSKYVLTHFKAKKMVAGLSAGQKTLVAGMIAKMSTDHLNALSMKIDSMMVSAKNAKTRAILSDIKAMIETEISNRSVNINQLLNGTGSTDTTSTGTTDTGATSTGTTDASTTSTGTTDTTSTGTTVPATTTSTGTTAPATSTGSTSTGTTTTSTGVTQ